MKLIIREYLTSLRERNELDALLPDLLSQMGLEVFSKPGIGNRQYGVDVAAYGSIEGATEKVYLFSVKSGDLGRKDWNSGSVQDLQPSLDEIRNTYIPTHLPIEYKDKPIDICICFGGDMKEEIRLNVSSYETQHKTDQISFSEWGGEKLSGYLEKYLLKEELLPENCQRLIRKSLAMLDEPDISVKHYRQLAYSLSTKDYKKKKDRLTAIRQLYLCLWIIYSWCREADNVEAAYQASEISLLHAWEPGRKHLGKNDKVSKSILQTTNAILLLNIQINSHFFEDKLFPHVGNLYALSTAARPSCHLDTNLKLFDILGRMALSGLWLHWYLGTFQSHDEFKEICCAFQNSIDKYHESMKKLIMNNPVLFTPIKDDQAIDITLAILFLAIKSRNQGDIHVWLSQMTIAIRHLLTYDEPYPCHLNQYHELLDHPQKDEDGYKDRVTQASILYPYMATFSAIFGFDDVYAQIQELKKDQLSHCNFQFWYPDETSEEHYYIDNDIHGATLSHLPIDEGQNSFLDIIFKECGESKHFEELSAIQYRVWPLILMAARHYRLPVPVHYLKDYWQQKPAND